MRRSTLVWMTCTGAALLAACQLVAGIESRPTDPLVPGCTLPTSGARRVRFANLVPDDASVDLCVRPSGSATGRPVFRGGGTDCPAGVAYSRVTAPFAAAERVDVKVIPAGSTCAAAALSEATLDVPDDAVLTILRVGGNGIAEQILAAPEQPETDPVDTRIRFVNALPSGKALNWGIPFQPIVPADLELVFLEQAVPFAHVVPGGVKSTLGKIDDRGYLIAQRTPFTVGVAEEGSLRTIFVNPVPGGPLTSSLFAIGNPRDLGHPPRGLFCSEYDLDGLFAKCSLTSLPSLSIDTFNISLYGPNARAEVQRRPAIFAKITERDSDLMCVLEAARREDRDAVIAAGAAGHLKYAQTADTTLDTPPTDARNAVGVVPPAPSTPACGGTVPTKQVDDAFACVVNNCSTKPGDAGGVLAGSTDCISINCAPEFLALQSGSLDQKRCFDCIVYNVASQASYAQSRLSCTTDLRPPFAHGGQNPSMVLSRYPLAQQETYVFPATGYRRTILRSVVQLQQGSTVDFYCAQLSSSLVKANLPYTGSYGEGEGGWAAEQLLQAQRLVDWVKQKSAGRQAIIAGDWHASAQYTRAGADGGVETLVTALNPETIDALRAGFVEATAPGFVPSCTFCTRSINAYNGALEGGYFFVPTFLFGFPDKATTSVARAFDEHVVQLSDGSKGALSEYYGLNVRVLRP